MQDLAFAMVHGPELPAMQKGLDCIEEWEGWGPVTAFCWHHGTSRGLALGDVSLSCWQPSPMLT